MRFSVRNLFTTRPLNQSDFSLEIQRCEGASVTHKYRRWHTLSCYLNRRSIVRRTHHNGTYEMPFEPHWCGLYPARDCESVLWSGMTYAIHLHLSPRLLDEVAQQMLPPGRWRLQRRFGVCDPVLFELLVALSESGLDDYIEQRTRVLAVARHVAQRYLRLAPDHKSKPVVSPRVGAMPLDELLDQMHDSFAVSHNVSTLAQLSQLSVRQFSHNFGLLFGASAHDYLLRSRVENAKHALQLGDRTVTDIALANGFYDHAHFTRTFRQRVGLSPSEFQDRFGA